MKLEKLGIHATDEQMYTSSLATIDYIKQHHPEAKRLFTLGTPSMQEEFVKAGFELCADDPADRPDVLVVAFDTTLEYSRLCRATWWASKADIPYIATTAFATNTAIRATNWQWWATASTPMWLLLKTLARLECSCSVAKPLWKQPSLTTQTPI